MLPLDKAVGTRVSTELLPKGKLAIDIDGSWLPYVWMQDSTKWAEWQDTIGLAKMPTQKGQATRIHHALRWLGALRWIPDQGSRAGSRLRQDRSE